MSIRTIVEFNHDYISQLHKDGHLSEELYRAILDSCGRDDPYRKVQGIRVLGQRHHSETLKLEVA